ncbi:DUF2461 domain-containing protein [Spongiimicrobium salis]|uniref:DUF2461 domain-containing protein n=1 Tax=Spongiimicrobium salis TaxID=1667022 RepID=UPI00374D7AB3
MISKTYTSFFTELKAHNTKAWFHANKKRYEDDVKAPFLALLDEILPILTEWDSRIFHDPKKALFRIHRDVRFSKDKSPYHLILKAGFSPHGKKSSLPGYYLGIDAESIHVGGGLFMLPTAELKRVREYIAQHTSSFLSIVQHPDFIQSFGALSGEKSKRLDKTLREAAQETALMYNKQFYAMAEFPLAPFYNTEELLTEIMTHFQNIKPLNAYLNRIFE